MELKPSPSIQTKKKRKYSEDYKSYVFRFWYNNSKRGAIFVLDNIPIKVDWVTGSELTKIAVHSWIVDDFGAYADFLDDEVRKKFDHEMVKERVDMLTRHAQFAQELQDMAMGYIRDHGVETARNAITALVQGINIERDSRGLPLDELLQLKDKSDKELIDELRDFVSDSKILEIGPAEVERDEPDAEEA